MPDPVQLVTEHLSIAARAAAYGRRRYPWLDRDDLASDANLALLLAAMRFDPGRATTPFADFARWHCRKAMNRAAQRAYDERRPEALPADVADDDAGGGLAGLVAADERAILAWRIEGLPARCREVMRRTMAGETTAEIAKGTRMTQGAVRMLAERGTGLLRAR